MQKRFLLSLAWRLYLYYREKALAKTSYKGVQLAMDWLFAHEDEADIDDPVQAPQGHTLGGPQGAAGQFTNFYF